MLTKKILTILLIVQVSLNSFVRANDSQFSLFKERFRLVKEEVQLFITEMKNIASSSNYKKMEKLIVRKHKLQKRLSELAHEIVMYAIEEENSFNLTKTSAKKFYMLSSAITEWEYVLDTYADYMTTRYKIYLKFAEKHEDIACEYELLSVSQ